MTSKIREWIYDLNIGERQMVLFRKMRILAESHLSTMVCGTMFGSSAALPFLYPLKLSGLCLLDFGFFACSAILFAVLNARAIALHGHYTLVGSIVVVTLILLSQRNSLEAFGPYIPVSVALSLLVTVHVVPWFETYFHQRNGITLGDYVTATRGDRSGGSHRAAVDPYSVRSGEGFYSNSNRGWLPDGLEFQHMDHLDRGYQTTTRPDSPDHSSSLDLETGLPRQGQSSTAYRSERSFRPAEDQSSGGFTESMDRTWTTEPLNIQHMNQGGPQTTRPYLPEHSSILSHGSGLPQQDQSSTGSAEAQSSTASVGSREPFL